MAISYQQIEGVFTYHQLYCALKCALTVRMETGHTDYLLATAETCPKPLVPRYYKAAPGKPA
jgi:hypothetical protein